MTKKKKLLTMVLAALTACSMFAGCGGNETAKSDDMTIRAIFGTEPESMDPDKATGAPEATYLGEIFEGLTALDKEGQPVPAAAESWDISDDGLTYTFHLRDNKWSNGDPVTAQDFEFAWKRLMSPELASEYAYMLFPIKGGEEYNTKGGSADDVGVKAIDDKTLEVHLARPTAYFLMLLAHQSAFPVNRKVVQEHPDDWAAEADTLVGNGPFKIVSWDHNSKITVEKRDDYWDHDKVKAKKIEMPLIDNMSTAVSMFDNGDVDLVLDPPAADAERLKGEGKLQLDKNIGTFFFDTNNKLAPFDNPKVRKAFSLALDRQTLVDQVLHGLASPATGWIPTGFTNPATKKDFAEESGKLVNENVEEAKKLLAEAGYPDGKGMPPITLLYNTNENNKAICEAAQEMWKKNLGVDVELTNQEWKVYLQSRKSGTVQIARARWVGDYLDPMTFADYLLSNGTNNYGRYANPKYDEFVHQAQNSNDPSVRMQAMHEAEKICIDDMGLIPVFFYKTSVAMNPKLKGVVDPGNTVFDFKYAYIEK